MTKQLRGGIHKQIILHAAILNFMKYLKSLKVGKFSGGGEIYGDSFP
jgi:hypothetical protein